MEHVSDVIQIVVDALGTVTKGLVKGLEEMEIRGLVETIQTTACHGIGDNTEKSLGDLMRLAVTQTPVEVHQLTLV